MLGNPYAHVDAMFERECAEQDAYERFIEEFDYAELLAGCDELGDLALAVINQDTVELANWKSWIDNQVEQKFIEAGERAKEEAAEAKYDAYVSSMEDCF